MRPAQPVERMRPALFPRTVAEWGMSRGARRGRFVAASQLPSPRTRKIRGGPRARCRSQRVAGNGPEGAESDPSEAAGVSSRAQRALGSVPYYFTKVDEANSDLWRTDNPDGFINASVAENVVSSSMMLDRLQVHNATTPPDPLVLKYPQPFHGVAPLVYAMCGLLQRTTMRACDVVPDNLIVSAGVSAVLDNLFFLLQDERTSCGVVAPYYPMFDIDLKVKANVTCVPVHLNTKNITAAMDSALQNQAAAGCPLRSVLITSPDNPTGRIYSRDSVCELLRWCHEHGVHCVMDEIYALSVFPLEAPFVSGMAHAMEVARTLPDADVSRFWDHVHVVFGLSKDFCGSGFRVGGLYTHNGRVLEAYRAMAHLSMVPTPLQMTLAEVLSDGPFVDEFLAWNAAQLEGNAAVVTRALDAMQVPYVKPQGGFFVWANFGERLGIDSFEDERTVWRNVFDKSKVLMVPGETCKAAQPGFFRICFASMPRAAVECMMARLGAYVSDTATVLEPSQCK